MISCEFINVSKYKVINKKSHVFYKKKTRSHHSHSKNLHGRIKPRPHTVAWKAPCSSPLLTPPPPAGLLTWDTLAELVLQTCSHLRAFTLTVSYLERLLSHYCMAQFFTLFGFLLICHFFWRRLPGPSYLIYHSFPQNRHSPSSYPVLLDCLLLIPCSAPNQNICRQISFSELLTFEFPKLSRTRHIIKIL